MFNDLRPASYNRVPFYVVASELNFGRRTVVHEYPQGDTPFVEDMGKATRRFSIQAFILGDDYVAKAENLKKEFEKPVEEGGATLVHPWLGSIKVFPVDTPTISWNLDKRTATLKLNFVEAGELRKPSIGTSWGSYLLDKANAFYDSILSGFDADSITNYVAEVSSIANGMLGGLADSNWAKALGVSSNISELMSDISSVMTSPDKLKDAIVGGLSIASLASTSQDWQGVTENSTTACEGLYSQTEKADSLSNYASDKETAITEASASLEQSFRLMLLGNAVAGASYIGSDFDQNLEKTQVKPFAEDVIEIRNTLMSALETEMRLLGTDDHDLYSMLSDTYSAVYQQLSNVASELGSVETVTPSEVTSSLELAYEKYGDASRDLEIVQRNNIPNPLFVPCEQLKVASR